MGFFLLLGYLVCVLAGIAVALMAASTIVGLFIWYLDWLWGSFIGKTWRRDDKRTDIQT